MMSIDFIHYCFIFAVYAQHIKVDAHAQFSTYVIHCYGIHVNESHILERNRPWILELVPIIYITNTIFLIVLFLSFQSAIVRRHNCEFVNTKNKWTKSYFDAKSHFGKNRCGIACFRSSRCSCSIAHTHMHNLIRVIYTFWRYKKKIY